jgi:hypothetical protein
VAVLVDHLWQSTLCCLVLAGCAALSFRVAAIVRLWMWRIAALKFVLPFALLTALGAWWGMPPHHAADPPPAGIVAAANAITPWFAPAQAHDLAGARAWLAFAVLVPAVVLCAWICLRGARLESARAQRDDANKLSADVASPPGVGFLRAMLFTSLALCLVCAPIIAGAMNDRVDRYAKLVENARSMHDAEVLIQEAKAGMGQRLKIVAGDDSVLIRNANLQDLVAMVYGVNSYAVFTNQFQATQLGETWLYSPRYDVRVVGHVSDPARFDTYALRVPVTRLLSTQFGLEIYVNSKCQPPCGRWDVAVADSGL